MMHIFLWVSGILHAQSIHPLRNHREKKVWTCLRIITFESFAISELKECLDFVQRGRTVSNVGPYKADCRRDPFCATRGKMYPAADALISAHHKTDKPDCLNDAPVTVSNGDFSLSSHPGRASFSSFVRQYNLPSPPPPPRSPPPPCSPLPWLLLSRSRTPMNVLLDVWETGWKLTIYLKWLIAKLICTLLWSRPHSVLVAEPVLGVPRHHRWSTCGCPYSCVGGCDFLSCLFWNYVCPIYFWDATFLRFVRSVGVLIIKSH